MNYLPVKRILWHSVKFDYVQQRRYVHPTFKVVHYSILARLPRAEERTWCGGTHRSQERVRVAYKETVQEDIYKRQRCRKFLLRTIPRTQKFGLGEALPHPCPRSRPPEQRLGALAPRTFHFVRNFSF